MHLVFDWQIGALTQALGQHSDMDEDGAFFHHAAGCNVPFLADWEILEFLSQLTHTANNNRANNSVSRHSRFGESDDCAIAPLALTQMQMSVRLCR